MCQLRPGQRLRRPGRNVERNFRHSAVFAVPRPVLAEARRTTSSRFPATPCKVVRTSSTTWHAGCSTSCAEGGTSKQVQQRIAGPPSGLAGSAGSGRGYEPRLTTTHQVPRPASLECMRFLRHCDGGTASCGGTRSTRSVPSTTRGSRTLRRCKDTGPLQRRPTLGDVQVVAVNEQGQCPLLEGVSHRLHT